MKNENFYRDGFIKNPVDKVQIEEVIVIIVTVGNGTEKSPYMQVKQYWTKSGNMIGQFNL